MGWAKITATATGEVEYSSTPDAYDADLFDVLPIVGDRCPVGLEEVDPVGNIFVPVDALRAQLIDQVKALRALKTAAGVTIAGVGTVQTDDTSRGNITGLVVMAQVAIASGAPFSEPFTMADNSVVTFDAPGMIAMGVAVGQYVAAVYARGRDLRDAIEAATSVDDLAAIDIEAGWPE